MTNLETGKPICSFVSHLHLTKSRKSKKNHTLFRDIVPAGHSFDAFTQQDVNLIFSHINAVKRKQFGGKSAYDLFTFFNSVELAQILGISYISPNDVIQSPLMLKKL